MTDNDARIEAIRAKAEGMGLTIMEVERRVTQQIAIRLMKHHGIEAQEIAEVYDLTTAERLLAALAPGPVVDIRHTDADVVGTFCHNDCEYAKGFHWSYDKPRRLIKRCRFASQHPEIITGQPGPLCPSPAPPGYEWRLCLLPKERGEQVREESITLDQIRGERPFPKPKGGGDG